MKWKTLTSIAVFALLLSPSGCAARQRRRALLQEIESGGVDAAVYARVKKTRKLDLGDIEHLVEKGVPDKTILFFLQRTDTVYSLKAHDIDRLRKSNVSDGLIDSLLATSSRFECSYGYGTGYPYYGHRSHHYGHRSHHFGHGHHY